MTTSLNTSLNSLNLLDALKKCLKLDYWSLEGLSAHATTRSPSSKVAVIYGDNASGKSFFFKKLIRTLKELVPTSHIQEIFLASMSMRTGSSDAQTFMYPRESKMSTGDNSVRAIKGCFYNGKSRSHPVWLFFDEPDMGLSSRYASAMGCYLAQEVNALPDHIKGVCIVSHSGELLDALLANLNEQPHTIGLATTASLSAFIEQQRAAEASVEDLLNLGKSASDTSRRIYQLEDKLKLATNN